MMRKRGKLSRVVMRKRELTITRGRDSKQWRSWQSGFVADIVTFEGDDSRAAHILFIITALQVVANYVHERKDETYEASIMTTTTELAETRFHILGDLQFAFTAWDNLLTPPECEKSSVVAWMIAAKNYKMNHFLIS
jgi:hypothetical protein